MLCSFRRESELDVAWTLGTVDQLVQGRDGLSRRAIVRYQNFKEDFHRFSDRGIRSVVKVWSVDDQNVDEDLAALQKRLRKTPRGAELVDQLVEAGPQGLDAPAPPRQLSHLCVTCCCDSHCKFTHYTAPKPDPVLVSLLSHRAVHPVHESSLVHPAQIKVEDHDETADELLETCECSLTALMNNLSLNLD